MIPIETVDAILEYLKDCERIARRIRRRTLALLAVVALGAISTAVFTTRDIAQGDPWWLTTLDVLLLASGAVPATVFTRRLRDARRWRAEIVKARARLYGSKLFDVWLTAPATSGPRATKERILAELMLSTNRGAPRP